MNEATAAQLKDMALSQFTEQEANAVNQRENYKMPKAPKQNGKGPKDHLSTQCKYCSKRHKRKIALHTEKPALHVENPTTLQQCFKNSRKFKKKCSQKPKHKKVNQLDDISESLEEEILSVSLAHTTNTVDMSKLKNKVFAHMDIGNDLVKMQVDSGTSCNVLPCKFLPRDTEIKKTKLKLSMYSKMNLKVLDVVKLSLQNPKNKKKYRAEFAIIDEDYTPFLSSSAAQQMRLITVQQENILQVKDSYQELDAERIVATYPDVFQGLGFMEGVLHLEVDESASPSIMPPHCVPLTLRKQLKEELAPLKVPM